MNSVLILSGYEDAHAQHMCSVLKSKNIPYFLFPTELYPFGIKLNLEFGGNYSLEFEDRRIILDEDWNIWNRRVFPPVFPEDYPKNLEGMVQTEAKLTLHGFMQTHKGRVINRPLANMNASNKFEQLMRARKLGFRVPDTLVSNNPEQALAFYRKHKGDIIFKMQKLPIIQVGDEHRTIMTSRVSASDLEDLEKIQNCPCMFQERISKGYEIRLTVIGDRLFPIAIHSQDSEYSKDDFRRYDFENVRYALVDIPLELKTKVLQMVKEYQLDYAALDIICTPSDEYVFLEINPNGQYLWTEELSQTPITEYFVDYLAGVNYES